MAVNIDKGSALSNLSLTPLIDIVFLLLIFFLVATEFAEEEHDMKVNLAEASEARPTSSPPQEITINVRHLTKGQRKAGVGDRRQPRYYVTGKVLNLAQLEQVLQQASVDNPGRSAAIRADRQCGWEYVVAAINACYEADIRHSIANVRKPGG